MSGETRLAHTTDPWTSSYAAERLNPAARRSLKLALIDLLDGAPATGDELISAYFTYRDQNGWPSFSDRHNVKRRLSELHTTHHVVRNSGTHRLSAEGRPAIVWELAVTADKARRIIATR